MVFFSARGDKQSPAETARETPLRCWSRTWHPRVSISVASGSRAADERFHTLASPAGWSSHRLTRRATQHPQLPAGHHRQASGLEFHVPSPPVLWHTLSGAGLSVAALEVPASRPGIQAYHAAAQRDRPLLSSACPMPIRPGAWQLQHRQSEAEAAGLLAPEKSGWLAALVLLDVDDLIAFRPVADRPILDDTKDKTTRAMCSAKERYNHETLALPRRPGHGTAAWPSLVSPSRGPRGPAWPPFWSPFTPNDRRDGPLLRVGSPSLPRVLCPSALCT